MASAGASCGQCDKVHLSTGNIGQVAPEPCPFLSRKVPVCSVIRPTETKDAALGALGFLTDMGLFIGQSPEFFEFMRHLAEDADMARRHGR
jgi:hypothetical protein